MECKRNKKKSPLFVFFLHYLSYLNARTEISVQTKLSGISIGRKYLCDRIVDSMSTWTVRQIDR